MNKAINDPITAAVQILAEIGLPSAQHNERSALTLLALLNLTPGKAWEQAENPLMGITPIMDWMRQHYQKEYAPNSRETVRRFTMHQFVQAGLVAQNPDMPGRPTNSPDTVYQIRPEALEVIRYYGSPAWLERINGYINRLPKLVEVYAREREQVMIPIQISPDATINIGPGEHNELIRDIIQDFAPRFVPGGTLVYVGDTGEKWGYFNSDLLAGIGVQVDPHGKMPDVVIYFPDKNWLLLIESVTSHGPVDSKRHIELVDLFSGSTAGLVFVTAFPDRPTMSRYLSDIAWETEVWVADAPSHLIHFNGSRFLGPY